MGKKKKTMRKTIVRVRPNMKTRTRTRMRAITQGMADLRLRLSGGMCIKIMCLMKRVRIIILWLLFANPV